MLNFLQKDLEKAQAQLAEAQENYENREAIANENADNVFDITVTFNEYYVNGPKAPYQADRGELVIFGGKVTIATSYSRDDLEDVYVKVLKGKIVASGTTNAHRPMAVEGTTVFVENVDRELIERYSDSDSYTIELYPRSEEKRNKYVEKEIQRIEDELARAQKRLEYVEAQIQREKDWEEKQEAWEKEKAEREENAQATLDDSILTFRECDNCALFAKDVKHDLYKRLQTQAKRNGGKYKNDKGKRGFFFTTDEQLAKFRKTYGNMLKKDTRKKAQEA